MTTPNQMKLVSLVFCLLVGILTLAACSRKSAAAGPAAPEVLVTTVAPRDVPVIKEGVATLNGFIES
jgi:multidrug efflux pump subunit AcrA (membrane-fusion protein)